MRFLADENFDNDILKGIINVLPDVDIIRAQDTELFQAPDSILLEWAAREGRIVLSHDVQTLAGYANERVRAGLPMPGVIEVRKRGTPIGQAIDEWSVMIGAGEPEDFENLVRFVPMR
jgi:hypothetical protein